MSYDMRKSPASSTYTHHRDRGGSDSYSSRHHRYDDHHRKYSKNDRYRDDDYEYYRSSRRYRSRSRDRHSRTRDRRSRSRNRRSRSRDRDKKYTKDRKARNRSRSREREYQRRSYTKSRSRSLSYEKRHINRRSRSRSHSREHKVPSTNSIDRFTPESNNYSNDVKSNEIKQIENENSIHHLNGLNDEDSNFDAFNDFEFDKEKIHKEMQERLRKHLAAEGKIYPPPKPQASHPIFANDGSFLETFKKIQEQQQIYAQQSQQMIQTNFKVKVPENIHKINQNPINPMPMPLMYGKRRGGKILKTGVVEKARPIQDLEANSVKDAWAMYMQEVKKYKNSSCEISTKARPLLK